MPRLAFAVIFAISAVVLSIIVGALVFFAEVGVANPKTADLAGLWINFTGSLHPVFLHLPIGALVLILVLESARVISFGRLKTDMRLPLIFAFGSSLLALITGYCLYLTGNYSGELISLHKRDAFIFCGVLMLTTGAHLATEFLQRWKKILQAVYLVGLMGSGALMTIAGHYGGEITHGDPLDQLPPTILAERKAAAEALAKDPIVFTQIVQPIFEQNCVYCHGADKQEGDFRMDSMEALLKGGEEGPGLVAGDPEKSAIIQRIHLPLKDDLHMPPSDKPQLSADEITYIAWWITEGASTTARVSELHKSPEVETALANLVSPEQRKAMEEEQKQAEKKEIARVAASKARMGPAIARIEANNPGSLKFISAGTDSLRFILHSHATSFGLDGMSALNELGGNLVEADLTLSVMDAPTLSRVSEWSGLRRLNVSQTAADDSFVESIAQLPALESLNLFGTKVTTACSDSLAKMKSLQVVYVSGTAFDEATAATLQERLSQGRETPVQVIGPSKPLAIVAPTPLPSKKPEKK